MAKENIAPLKFLVYSMGIVLMGGIVLIVGLLFSKLGGDVSRETLAGQCKDITIGIGGYDGELKSLTTEGPNIILTFLHSGSYEIVTVDRCSGEPVNRILVTAKPSSSDE